ncbi:MAG TPA: hypothetical protein PKA88_18840 [Polyangiaceae bacterium]|nr:hypothetical protein [Polyangiaceae bacterium]
MQRTTLILMESGALWPTWLDAASGAAETLWQAHNEKRLDFFDAALERIRAGSDALKSVVLVCAPTDSVANAAARGAFLSGIASALEFHTESAEMVLVSDGDYGTRAALAHLVLQISTDLEHAGSDTRIRLRAQPRSTRPPPAMAG